MNSLLALAIGELSLNHADAATGMCGCGCISKSFPLQAEQILGDTPI